MRNYAETDEFDFERPINSFFVYENHNIFLPSPCNLVSVANKDCQCCGMRGSEEGGGGATVIKTSASSPSLGIGIPDTSVLRPDKLG